MFSCKYSIAKFLGTPVLQDICEQLFERFATWANNKQQEVKKTFFQKQIR